MEHNTHGKLKAQGGPNVKWPVMSFYAPVQVLQKGPIKCHCVKKKKKNYYEPKKNFKVGLTSSNRSRPKFWHLF